MTYNPSPIKRESVISQAAQEICRYIAAEKLNPGEALPPETRLSGMLGISRNSLREALRVLHGLGYVEKAAGQRVVVTAASQTGKSMFDESVLIEAAPIANEVRSHIAQKCAELSAERLTPAEIAELESSLAALERAIARRDLAAAKSAHDAFHGLLLASARNPLLVAMFNQAQVARLSNISPEHQSFYDPRHLGPSSRAAAGVAQARPARRKRGGAQAFPEPRADARIRDAEPAGNRLSNPARRTGQNHHGARAGLAAVARPASLRRLAKRAAGSLRPKSRDM